MARLPRRRPAWLALRWSAIICLLVFCAYESCKVAWLKMGTDVVGTYTSPTGRWQAVLMSCDGGAMSGFSTQVSVPPTAAYISRWLSLCATGTVFVADDNHGAVAAGAFGQIAVSVTWTSPRSLAIKYPGAARVFKRDLNAY